MKDSKKETRNLRPALLTSYYHIFQLTIPNQYNSRFFGRHHHLQNKTCIIPRRHIAGRVTVFIRGRRTILLTTGNRYNRIIRSTDVLYNFLRHIPPTHKVGKYTIQVLNLAGTRRVTNFNVNCTRFTKLNQHIGTNCRSAGRITSLR